MQSINSKKERTGTIVKFIIPSMLTNISFFLFTVIDGIFVGRGVGANALGAVSIAYPIIMVVFALVTLVTTGGLTIVAIRFGRGDDKGANKAFAQSFTLALIIAVIFTFIGLVFTKQIAMLLGANDTYADMVAEYIFYYFIFLIPGMMEVNLMGFCRNDGSPMLVGASTVAVSALNIFLDWLFVFPLKLGLMGAACATGISETIGFFAILSHFVLKKGKLRIRFAGFDRALIKKICVRGLPDMVGQFAAPVMVICYNWVLITMIGDAGVNAFSIIDYIASFTIAVCSGTSEGYQPLWGNAFGAKDRESLGYYLKSAIGVAISGSLVCIALILLFSRQICGLFGATGDVLEYTVSLMPKYAWGFVFTGINMVISAYFYSTKQSGKALIISILRSFVLDIAVILLLPQIFGAGIIWYAFGIFEMMGTIVAVSLLRSRN